MFTVKEIVELAAVKRRGGDPEAVVTSVTCDSRGVRPGSLFLALPNRCEGVSFAAEAAERGAVAVMCHPKSRLPELPASVAVLEGKDPVAACGRLAAAHRDRLLGQVIAITGSTGKTTTKELTHWLLGWTREGSAAPASYNNALGVALTLLAARVDDDYLVVEIGTSAPGEIDALAAMVRPNVGVITGVAPTHLAGLGSIEEVATEKSALFQHIQRGGVAVKNLGDLRVVDMEVPTHVTQIGFVVGSSDDDLTGVELTGRVVSAGIEGLCLDAEFDGEARRIQTRLIGRHNAANVMGALAAARTMDGTCLVPERWTSFRSPPMRMEVVEREGVTYLNDAYNANPDSMRAALLTLAELPAGQRIAVLGEMGELGRDSESYHRELGATAAGLSIDGLVTVGDVAGGIAAGAREAGFEDGRIREAPDIDEARQALDELRAPGEGRLVLLKASRAAGLESLLA